MKYLIIGANGMAGNAISLYLTEKGYNVYTLTRKPFNIGTNIISDVKDTQIISQLVLENNFDCIVNAVGILNQSAEISPADAVFINSYIPHYLTQITKNLKTKIIHISTDCVFSGLKGEYLEHDFKDGITMYDRTKALGEIYNSKDLTIRTSIIGPDMKKDGIGLFNWFMLQDEKINGYTKVYWTGITTLVLAKAIEVFSKSKISGIIHLTNNIKISKFDLLSILNLIFMNNQLKINEYAEKELDKSLLNTRNDLDFLVPNYETMLYEMRNWIYEHINFYPHYQNKVNL